MDTKWKNTEPGIKTDVPRKKTPGSTAKDPDELKNNDTAPAEKAPHIQFDETEWEEWATQGDDGEAGRMSCHWAVKLLVWAVYIIGMCYAARGVVMIVALRQPAMGANYLFWGGTFALGALLWLVYTAGKSYWNNQVRLLWVDRVYLEIYLALAIIGIVVSSMLMSNRAIGSIGMAPVDEFAYGEISGMTLLWMYLPIGLFSALTCSFVLSVVRRVRLHVLYRYSLIRIIAKGFVRTVRLSFRSLAPHTAASRALLLCIMLTLGEVGSLGIAILLFFELGVLGLMTGILLVVFYNVWMQGRVLVYVRELERIVEDIRRIGAGELTHRVAPSVTRYFDGLVEGVNDIAKGMEAALDERVKSERMRTELITNVSHDLRTPLTSLVTYVDLLKQEGQGGAHEKEYLDIIDRKVNRLRVLTDDLFEAAKAASGTLPVELGRIDLQELISQGLAEMEDRVEASGLTVQTSFPNGRIVARADGRRLWRALSNLVDNALKYSLEHTRIYLEVSKVQDRAAIVVKNISRDPVKNPQELTRRFARGDQSRSREGSGLGLSISQSLCQLMGGELQLAVDGDLFKATIFLPLWQEKNAQPSGGGEKYGTEETTKDAVQASGANGAAVQAQSDAVQTSSSTVQDCGLATSADVKQKATRRN